MKAAVLARYGAPQNIEVRNRPKPSPGAGEVLVKVHAAAVNDWDWNIVCGKPFYIRLLCGLFAPKIPILGVDVAGEVEAVGRDVSKFTPGEAVYGDLSEAGFGAFAEYVAVGEDALSRKPDGIGFAEAAALPHAATLALQGLRDVGAIKPDQTVLINGAGGGVGTVALQMARQVGVRSIAGVDHGEKLAMMRALGFDDTIDYTQEDFTASGRRFDLILDTKTNRSPLRYLKALNPHGRYVTIGGVTTKLLQTLLLRPFIERLTTKSLRMVFLKTNQDLVGISEMVAAGKIRPVIDGRYSLAELPAALDRFGQGRHCGKIVIEICSPESLTASGGKFPEIPIFI